MKTPLRILVPMTLLVALACSAPQTVSHLKPTMLMVSPVESKEGIFADEVISVRLSPAAVGVDLLIKNRSNKVMNVKWDSCAIVGPDGVSMRVIHSGVRVAQKEQAQTPTVIPPDAQVSDVMFPADKVVMDNVYEGWRYNALFKASDVNGDFTVLLAVELDGQPKNYIFKFKIVALA